MFGDVGYLLRVISLWDVDRQAESLLNVATHQLLGVTLPVVKGGLGRTNLCNKIKCWCIWSKVLLMSIF